MTPQEINAMDGAGGTHMDVGSISDVPVHVRNQISASLMLLAGHRQFNPMGSRIEGFDLVQYEWFDRGREPSGVANHIAARSKRTGKGQAGFAIEDPSRNNPHLATAQVLCQLDTPDEPDES